jgi:hypothetical protein
MWHCVGAEQSGLWVTKRRERILECRVEFDEWMNAPPVVEPHMATLTGEELLALSAMHWHTARWDEGLFRVKRVQHGPHHRGDDVAKCSNGAMSW